MVVTKMKQAKIKCREYDCWSLTCDIKKKGYKTIHVFTQRIEDKTNDNNDKNNNKSNNNNVSINDSNNNSNHNNSNDNNKTKSK